MFITLYLKIFYFHQLSPPIEPLSSPISIPSSCDNTLSPSSEAENDVETENVLSSVNIFSKFRGLDSILDSKSITVSRKCPLPDLTWAEKKDMWHSMVLKDMIYPRDHNVLQSHPDLEPRMRGILLDWLTEV